MKRFFLFVIFFVGYFSPSLGFADPINYAALAPTVVRVDKSEKDYWFRRCTNPPFNKRARVCADTAWIVSVEDFAGLQDILMEECSKLASRWEFLDQSDECRKKLKTDLDQLTNAVSPSTWHFPANAVTDLGWILENRPELPRR